MQTVLDKVTTILEQFPTIISLEDSANRLERIEYLQKQLPEAIKIKLNTNQLAAILSLISDISLMSFQDSAMYNYLLRGNLLMAANDFANHAKVGRTVTIKKLNRRMAEKRLFESQEY